MSLILSRLTRWLLMFSLVSVNMCVCVCVCVCVYLPNETPTNHGDCSAYVLYRIQSVKAGNSFEVQFNRNRAARAKNTNEKGIIVNVADPVYDEATTARVKVGLPVGLCHGLDCLVSGASNVGSQLTVIPANVGSYRDQFNILSYF